MNNASYRAFGASVLAVAGGTVLETVDGLPENREVGASLGIDPAELRAWLRVPAQRRDHELPLLNAIVRFADPQSGQ